jgi:hypothetical protein
LIFDCAMAGAASVEPAATPAAPIPAVLMKLRLVVMVTSWWLVN